MTANTCYLTLAFVDVTVHHISTVWHVIGKPVPFEHPCTCTDNC